MSSQIYIIETCHGTGASVHSTAFLNREPNPGWSERFEEEAATSGSELVLRHDRIESSRSPEVSADEIVRRVNTLVAG